MAKQSNLARVTAFVAMMKANRVTRVKLGDMEIEMDAGDFNTTILPNTPETIVNLEPEPSAEELLFWSTNGTPEAPTE